MIDARDQVQSAVQSSHRRRSKPSTSVRSRTAEVPAPASLPIERVFSDPAVKPFDQIEWERRTAEITDEAGKVIFKQENVEVPKSWSVLATKVVVSKYFYGEQNTPERETSVRQLIHRVCRTMADWGVRDGYFDKAKGEIFYDELAWLCLNQYGAFNSPVWFNVGLFPQYHVGNQSARGNWFYNRQTAVAERARTQYEYPQGSACFIQSVDDNMESIMHLAHSEAMLFKYGSGTGTDLSPIRSSREKLSGGGRPSGPLSFLKVYDQVANVVKSGGKTRRAAKMNTLRDWHGDIEEFIDAKQKEEKKAWALDRAGLRRLLQWRRLRQRHVPKRKPLRPRQRCLHASRPRRQRMVDPPLDRRQPLAEERRGDLAQQDRRRHLDLRRSRPAIRRRHPKMAHLQGHRANPLHQSLLRIRLYQQHRLQPRLPQPDEIQARGREVRHRALQGGRPHFHHRPGNPGR